MAEQPILIEPIPPQVVHEGSPYGPLNLNYYIQSPDEESGKVRFSAETENGNPLPQGVICTSDGLLSGIPAKGTQGFYEFTIFAENDSSALPLKVAFPFTILEKTALDEGSQYFTSLKSQVWLALGKNLPLPEISDLFNRPLTAVEVYYLLQRFATLTIWDVYNLDPPGDKKLIQLEGASKHYVVYDRGSCLVGHPKDLFTYERTLQDALLTAKAMAREVHNRGWTIEFAGFEKMTRAAWVELQVLADRTGKSLEILHFHPTLSDFKLYENETKAVTPTPGRSA